MTQKSVSSTSVCILCCHKLLDKRWRTHSIAWIRASSARKQQSTRRQQSHKQRGESERKSQRKVHERKKNWFERKSENMNQKCTLPRVLMLLPSFEVSVFPPNSKTTERSPSLSEKSLWFGERQICIERTESISLDRCFPAHRLRN